MGRLVKTRQAFAVDSNNSMLHVTVSGQGHDQYADPTHWHHDVPTQCTPLCISGTTVYSWSTLRSSYLRNPALIRVLSMEPRATKKSRRSGPHAATERHKKPHRMYGKK